MSTTSHVTCGVSASFWCVYFYVIHPLSDDAQLAYLVFLFVQFTMLSGKVPFQSSHRDRSAESIMNRIKGGEFSMKGKEWESVSDAAKTLIRGLLTVDHKQRVTMTDLANNEWLTGSKNSEVHLILNRTQFILPATSVWLCMMWLF